MLNDNYDNYCKELKEIIKKQGVYNAYANIAIFEPVILNGPAQNLRPFYSKFKILQ